LKHEVSLSGPSPGAGLAAVRGGRPREPTTTGAVVGTSISAAGRPRGSHWQPWTLWHATPCVSYGDEEIETKVRKPRSEFEAGISSGLGSHFGDQELRDCLLVFTTLCVFEAQTLKVRVLKKEKNVDFWRKKWKAPLCRPPVDLEPHAALGAVGDPLGPQGMRPLGTPGLYGKERVGGERRSGTPFLRGKGGFRTPSPAQPLLVIGKKIIRGGTPPTTPGVWTPAHTSLTLAPPPQFIPPRVFI